MSRLAVVLFNLGGPDSPDAVRPFLFNLFRDPAIIGLPNPLRDRPLRFPLRGLRVVLVKAFVTRWNRRSLFDFSRRALIDLACDALLRF